MIRYDLVCEAEHVFEAWFSSSESYDKTAKAGANVCPVCGSTKVEKALMAPNVSAKTRKKGGATPADKSKMTLAASDPKQAVMRAALKELRSKITENADYVGDKFAEEARKIHYEESEPRGIYGEATGEEAKALIEEGVEVHPLPPVPDDKN